MSLNQTFLKLYEKEGAAERNEPVTQGDPPVSRNAEEKDPRSSFRVDRGHFPPDRRSFPEPNDVRPQLPPVPREEGLRLRNTGSETESARSSAAGYRPSRPADDDRVEMNPSDTIRLYGEEESRLPQGDEAAETRRRARLPFGESESGAVRERNRFSHEADFDSAEFRREDFGHDANRRQVSPRSSETAAPYSFRMEGWPEKYREIFRRGADEFADMADAVDSAARKGNKIFGFGGWGRSTGVTTLVFGILNEMLRRQCRVLLVDANFQRPQLAETIGVPDSFHSWEEILDWRENGAAGLVRVETAAFPFYLLPLYREGISDARAASSRKSWFHSFLELAEEFDLVLIDHGSLRTGNDREKVFELLRFGCDGYYLVTDTRSGLGGNAVSLPAVSDECRLPCFGIIENFT